MGYCICECFEVSNICMYDTECMYGGGLNLSIIQTEN